MHFPGLFAVPDRVECCVPTASGVVCSEGAVYVELSVFDGPVSVVRTLGKSEAVANRPVECGVHDGGDGLEVLFEFGGHGGGPGGRLGAFLGAKLTEHE